MRKFLKRFQNHEDYENYVESEEYITPSICACENENEVHYNKHIQPLTFIAEEDGCAICMSYYSYTDGFDYLCDFEYSLNGGEWTEYQKSMDDYSGGTTYGLDFELDEGESVSIRRCGDMENDFKNYKVSISGYVGAYGDITSLVNGVGGDCDLTFACFYEFFKEQTGLTHAPNLPSTTLGEECYEEMFAYCYSLVNAPDLPATNLGSLCCNRMFYECGSIISGPKILPAKTLYHGCYAQMFYECESLTEAPELPATTLADYCYDNMFKGCTALTKCPSILPAETTYERSCQYMFMDCSSLTNAPELPATTLGYQCYNGMFWGCTALTKGPSILPATSLASYCYYCMFNGCTSLTTAPELPATTLVSNCYREMFYYCTSLEYIKAMFLTTPSTAYTSSWVTNVKSTGTFVKNSSANWNVTGVHGIPTNWTVQTASS